MVNKMVNIMRRALTARQGEVLKAIEDFVLGRGFSPTIRELGAALGLRNPSAVLKHLRSLEVKGYIGRESGAIRLPGSYPHVLDPVRVPVAGLVPAGGPREVFEFSSEAMDVPAWMLGRRQGNVFCVRVEGKSMIDAYIDDGDHVLLERTDKAGTGDMVVVRLDDGSVTLKRLRIETGRILLVPENPAYQPFEVREVQILGRVIGVLRKY